jgi:TetR/AcrR family transcriptional regulator
VVNIILNKGVDMDDVLQNLDTEKRDRIINSAIEEFANYPFSKASTNTIVKNAGISKGLLFHYFGNKKDLYDYISKFVVEKLFYEVSERIDWENTDIFERIKQIALVKIELSAIYPQLFTFAISIFSQDNTINFEQAIKKYEEFGINVQELFTKVYQHNIDYTLFSDPGKIGMYIDIIRWTIEKFAEEKVMSVDVTIDLSVIKTISDEMSTYIDVLKKAFYA